MPLIEIEKNEKILVDAALLYTVSKWFSKLVKLDPKDNTPFCQCYESYCLYCTQKLNSPIPSKRVFGAAIRAVINQNVEKGKVIESRTGGLKFLGLTLSE